MNTAIIHDHFLNFGGAERVLLNFLKLYPSADVYLAFASPQNRKVLEHHTRGRIIVSLFDKCPLSHCYPDIYKPLLFCWWEHLDLRQYDVVISSSHSFSSKSVITHKNQLHISYVHTPPRYLYSEYNELQILRKPIIRFILFPLMNWMRKKDFQGAQRPDILIANSKNVQARIKKYYKRDSELVYPPVEIPKTLSKRRPQYYLCMSRLVKQKGIELAIRACNELKESLVIVGSGAQEKYLRSIAGPTIIFLGFVPDKQMNHIYAGAKALIYTSIEEDFGLVPLEAMAHGVPVIGYKSGGVEETIINGSTGIFFNDWNVASLVKTIYAFDAPKFSFVACLKQAKRFSSNRFKTAMILLISHYV